MAFSVVAIGVLVLRRTQPDLERPFRVPGYPVTPVLTVVACIYVLSGLALDHLADLRGLAAARAGVLPHLGTPRTPGSTTPLPAEGCLT